MKQSVKVIIKSEMGLRELSTDSGVLILELLREAGFLLAHPCGGRGVCGKCRVLVKGKLSAPSKAEHKFLSGKDLKAGIRLSCQARVLGDAEINLPFEAVVTDKIFQGAYPVKDLKGPFGLAIDLGTTTVGAFLVTLKDGMIHKGNAVLNQQASLGAEVISRLEYAAQGGAKELKKLAEASIKEAILSLGLSRKQMDQVKRMVVVSNSAMHHLFLGLPVENLMKFPFQPAEKVAKKLRTKFFGKELELWLPPLVGGFVGSDALACLLYFGFGTKNQPIAGVDLGTNGEVMVTDGKRILVASTAAGPAFEGVNIECGMRASRGAIASVRRADKSRTKVSSLEFTVIGGGKPRGIAGSGLLSLVNLLRKEGKIDVSGRLLGGKFFLTRKIYLSQSDVREVQKAKGAIRAAFEVLLENLGLKALDLEELILTGSFGARIDVKDALELGLIPKIPEERVKVFANGAGMGAVMMLNQEAFEFGIELSEKVEHLELFAEQRFRDKFIEKMRF